MMIILDTCSWLKVRRLDEEDILHLKDLIHESDLWTTHQLLVEYKHYLDDYLNLDRCSIQAVSINGIKHLSDKSLDDADVSLVQFCRQHQPNVLAICDDAPVLVLLGLFDIDSFQLSEFLLWLARAGIIKKRDASKGIRSLREWKNIKEKKSNLLQHELHELR